MLEKKTLGTVVAAVVYLAALIWVFPRYWKSHRSAIIVLSLGALGSFFQYVALRIDPVIEYKFMFPAIICLAPFPSLALEPYQRRAGRLAWPLFAIIAIVIAYPFFRKMQADQWTYQMNWGWSAEQPALINADSFDFKLDDAEPLAELYDAIRQETPDNSILVVEDSQHHLPALTWRQLYVPPSDQSFVGVNIYYDHLLLDLRGYDKQILQRRRTINEQLFESDSDSQRMGALEQILELGRPIVIILDKGNNPDLLESLVNRGMGQLIFEKNNQLLWIVES